MEHSLCILGRQPALGLAELESLYGAASTRPVGARAAILALAAENLNFKRLGGSTRLCKVLAELPYADWKKVETHLAKALPEYLQHVPEGKLKLGLSAIGFTVSAGKLNAFGLRMKKAIRTTGRSVRLVPNETIELSTAQVLHNNLTGALGREIVLVRDNDKTVVAQTLEAQDITSYTLRDRGRPKRDPRVGMLPPKLAQIIINLAVSGATPASKTVLDPFCGTGVVLQEALLMGLSVYGTDLESRMIEYTGANLDWLDSKFSLSGTTMRFEDGDATTHHWDPQPDFVACETYLGRPFTTLPSAELLNQTVSECNLIIKKFLQNIYAQLKPGTRLCVAVPAWQSRPGQFKHLPLIDQIDEIGYNRVKFEHVRDGQLLYYREGQIVGRELLVIIRK